MRASVPAAAAVVVALMVSLVFLPGCGTPSPEGLPASGSFGSPSGGSSGASSGGGSRRAAPEDLGSGVLGEPIVSPGSHYILIPFSLVRPESDRGKFGGSLFDSFSFSPSYSGGYAGSSLSMSEVGIYRHARQSHWNNLVVIDKRSGEARLALQSRAVIVGSFFPKSALREPPARDAQPQVPPHLLLVCADADTNGDRVINADDATTLYHVELSSLATTALTPADDTQFDDLTFDPDDARTVYVRSIRDSDGNRRFTETDQAVIAAVDLTKPAMGKPLVPDELVERAFRIVTGESAK